MADMSSAGIAIETVNILGFEVENVSIERLLADWRSKRFVVPINVDVLMKLRRDRGFRGDILDNAAEMRLVNDSQVIRFAVRLILGYKLGDRISGSDFLPEFCRTAEGARVFLLGGKDLAAEEAMRALNAHAGRSAVVDALSPTLGFDRKPEECAAIVERIRASGANMLAVGVGAPKQEKWILAHADRLPEIRMFMAVGATIDFQAGRVRRAPRWMSNWGLEWLFRLLLEPRRLYRRYLIEGPPFFWFLIKQRLTA